MKVETVDVDSDDPHDNDYYSKVIDQVPTPLSLRYLKGISNHFCLFGIVFIFSMWNILSKDYITIFEYHVYIESLDKDTACCMLGQIAGDKGYHCHAKFYSNNIMLRNRNRAHNRKLSFYG